VTYLLEQFERGETHDQLWNAAQGQPIPEGRIHNYLRMLWGKKILASSERSDGTITRGHPNVRIFGTVRYMSSESTVRKMPVKEYVRRYPANRHTEPRLDR